MNKSKNSIFHSTFNSKERNVKDMAYDLWQFWLLGIILLFLAGIFRSLAERLKRKTEKRRRRIGLSKSIERIEGLSREEEMLLRLVGIKTLGNMLDADLTVVSRKIKIPRERLEELRAEAEKLASRYIHESAV